MGMSRREMLRSVITAAGAVAVGGTVGRLAVKADAAGTPATAPKMPDMPGMPGMPALTADGKVVAVDSQGKHLWKPDMRMPPAAEPTGREGVSGRKWVMVLDLSRCDGCGKCTEACNKMHVMPTGRAYIPVWVLRDSKLATPYYFPRPCFHCDQPPCTKVCPVNATYKTQDGTVLIDNDRCIGCRFCIAACPYGARCFNWGAPNNPPAATDRGYSPEWGNPRRIGTVEKCDYCPDLAAKGILPACSSGCPMGVIYFGDQNEDAVTNSFGETMRLSTLLRDRAAYRHLEDLGTEPRCYYLPPVNRQYPPPGEAKKG